MADDDTDFKDSALGEEEQDFTEASVNEMELSNRQLRLTADEIMAKMDSLVKGVIELKEQQEQFQ